MSDVLSTYVQASKNPGFLSLQWALPSLSAQEILQMSMLSQGLSEGNLRSPRYSHIEAATGCAKEKGVVFEVFIQLNSVSSWALKRI